MNGKRQAPLEVLIVAVPESAGSALYGMLDVLSAAGNLWQTLVRAGAEQKLFRVRIVSPAGSPFRCGNGIPVHPDCSIADDPAASIVILPEIRLGPDESWNGRHPDLIDWIKRRYRDGATLYSACSGAVMLAETGLLDGLSATSHWGYQDLFRTRYPKVRFDPAPNLCYADPGARIGTAPAPTFAAGAVTEKRPGKPDRDSSVQIRIRSERAARLSFRRRSFSAQCRRHGKRRRPRPGTAGSSSRPSPSAARAPGAFSGG